ncbi:hypothetical protein [Devosia elaeis]|uniref:Secreted protein n=1 Tax=Devosia elaeis TaxID=1770058 RepID=A0A178I2B2_9HYPH|nr:hypothetical protein [Devosia elaeis]OAM79223.1 hypothetical protein A3840_03915 [Devosia elaeis]
MLVKSVVSALALTSAMLVAPVIAQDAAASLTIAGNPVAEEDQAAVQARCDELLALEGSTSSSVTTDTETGADDEDGPASQTSSNESPPAEGTANAATTIDLSTITLDDCVTGGWVTQP